MILSGHDVTLTSLGAILDIQWAAPPNSGTPYETPLSGGLMFTRHPSGRIFVDYVYPVFDHTITPTIKQHVASPPSFTQQELARRVCDSLELYREAKACAANLSV